MQLVKNTCLSIISLCLLASFSQCKSSEKAQEKSMQKSNSFNLQEKSPFELDEIYFQKWVAGIKGGGSGVHIYINVLSNKHNVELDSVYFRNSKGKITIGKMGYFASLKTPLNQKEDLIMSGDAKEEFGNTINLPEKMPFQLKDNECVISYKEKGAIKYFKIENLKEKQMIAYPSAPPKNTN